MIEYRVEKRMKVIYNYILYGLLTKKYQEFNLKDRQIKKDLELLLAFRKYLNVGKEEEDLKSLFNEIKDNLEVI